MIGNRTLPPLLLLLAAGCSGGNSGAGDEALRLKVEAQASEIEALKRAAKEMDARARALEERLSAAKADPAPAKPAPAEAAAADPVAEPTTQAVTAWLDTEQGKQKLVEAVETAEKRRTEKTEQEQRDRMVGFVKERVTGYLTEQLNLDSAQQQAVLAVAVDTTEKLGDIWKVMRENRGDPAALAQAREKTNELRQQAVEKIQQSLTVDQFNKFQEIMDKGGGGFLMGGFGGGPGGAGGAGGAGGRGGR